jgi:outer membrane protein insertion porin family/translocation and assembly module TamA
VSTSLLVALLVGALLGLPLEGNAQETRPPLAGEAEETTPPPTADEARVARPEASIEELREPPPGPIVKRIDWTGVTAFDEDELEERIVTTAQPRFTLRFWKPKRRLDEFVLQEDLDRIVAAYREIGHFEAEARVETRPLPGDRVVVEFEVHEGPRVRLESWMLEILASPDDEAPPSEAERERLRRQVDFVPGQIFGSRLYRDRRQALLETASELGFPSARIAGGAEVDARTRTARVDWTLHLGPRTFFGPIEVVGLERVDEKIVLRELRFQPGDRFAASKLRESERRLVSTDLFRTVVIGRPLAGSAAGEGEATPEDRFDVEVRVEEAPPRSLRLSVGYGTEEGPRGEVALDWRNFTGHARRLRTRAFASFLDAGFEATLGQPYVLGERARGDLAVSALRQARPGYEAFVTGASGLLTFYPDREGPWSLTVGPGYEYAHITDFSVNVGPPRQGPRQSVIVNWFTIGRYQNVDDLLDPRRGFRATLANELGGFPIGSELDFQRWELDLRAYWPTGPVVWAARAAATTLDPLEGGLAAVPLTRRLYSGGTNSIRGFGFQKLGPTDSANDPLGGLSRLETGVELRLPVWRRFGLVGFVDAGDVRTGTWSWRPQDLRASAGPGLRIATPIGPLRFDFGFLLNKPKGADPWRFHLSVGQAF